MNTKMKHYWKRRKYQKSEQSNTSDSDHNNEDSDESESDSDAEDFEFQEVDYIEEINFTLDNLKSKGDFCVVIL